MSIFALILVGCDSKELSRSQAQRLIEANADYKQPYALPLMQGFIAISGQGKLPILENATEAAEWKSNCILKSILRSPSPIILD